MNRFLKVVEKQFEEIEGTKTQVSSANDVLMMKVNLLVAYLMSLTLIFSTNAAI